MKFATLALLAPLLAPVLAISIPRDGSAIVARQAAAERNRGGNNGGKNNGGNNGGNNNGGNNGNNGNNGGNNGANADPQKSLVLDPKVIGANFAKDGQDQPDPGQVPSLTSTNNFINYCLTVPNLPITNGLQQKQGSCNPIPIGAIPSTDKMPSAKFVNPKNGQNIAANQPFTITMAIKNLATGNFVNAQKSYFAAPQQLDGSGTILGHSHVVVEKLTALDQTTPTNPNVFAFFKGLNEKAKNGVLTADVTSGLPAGAYRICSINSSSNHQPAIVAVAQHGSLDDCSYFTVGGAGGNTGNNGGNNTGNNGNNGGANNGNGNTGNTGNTGNNGGNTGNNGGNGGRGQNGNQQGRGRGGRGRRSGRPRFVREWA